MLVEASTLLESLKTSDRIFQKEVFVPTLLRLMRVKNEPHCFLIAENIPFEALETTAWKVDSMSLKEF